MRERPGAGIDDGYDLERGSLAPAEEPDASTRVLGIIEGKKVLTAQEVKRLGKEGLLDVFAERPGLVFATCKQGNQEDHQVVIATLQADGIITLFNSSVGQNCIREMCDLKKFPTPKPGEEPAPKIDNRGLVVDNISGILISIGHTKWGDLKPEVVRNIVKSGGDEIRLLLLKGLGREGLAGLVNTEAGQEALVSYVGLCDDETRTQLQHFGIRNLCKQIPGPRGSVMIENLRAGGASTKAATQNQGWSLQ